MSKVELKHSEKDKKPKEEKKEVPVVPEKK